MAESGKRRDGCVSSHLYSFFFSFTSIRRSWPNYYYLPCLPVVSLFHSILCLALSLLCLYPARSLSLFPSLTGLSLSLGCPSLRRCLHFLSLSLCPFLSLSSTQGSFFLLLEDSVSVFLCPYISMLLHVSFQMLSFDGSLSVTSISISLC